MGIYLNLPLLVSVLSFFVFMGIIIGFFKIFHPRSREMLAQRIAQVEGDWLDSAAGGRRDIKRIKAVRLERRALDILKFSGAHSFVEHMEYFLYRSGFFQRIRMWIIVFLYVFLGLFLGCRLWVHFGIFASIFMAVIAAVFLCFTLLKRQERKWKKEFVHLFPTALDIINRGLKAGLSISHGIAITAREIEDPVGFEFGYLAAQLEIGVSPEKAFNESATRVDVEDFRFFCLALVIQKEMGGSLIDVLSKLSHIIRERDKFRKKVSTLTAEGKMTAAIIGGLPLVTSGCIELLSPGYLSFFVNDPTGRFLLGVSVGLTTLGIVIINRMIKVENR